MKILQNEQAATIYIKGVKYEFVNGVCECEDNAKHADVFKEYNYIVEVAPVAKEVKNDVQEEEKEVKPKKKVGK